MAALYLIRHGQASFGKPEYDQLTEKGYQQSQVLADYWHDTIKPDIVYTGQLKRHKQTSTAFLNRFKKSSITLPSLDEFDHNDIIKSQSTSEIEQIKQLVVSDSLDLEQLNQHLLNALKRWVHDPDLSAYNEPWPAFKARAKSALEDITKARTPNQQNIVVFTSGGVIAAMVQHLLDLDDAQGLQILQQLRNTSVTKLLFSGQRISLDYLNNYQHLEQRDPSWSTYR